MVLQDLETLVESEEFNSKQLVGAYDTLNEVASYDFSKKGDIEKYRQLTGDMQEGREEIDTARQAIVQGSERTLAGYVDKFYKDVLKQVSNEEKAKIAMTLATKYDVQPEGVEESITGTIKESREELKKMAEDRNYYQNNVINNYKSAYLKRIMSDKNVAEKIMKYRQSRIANNIGLALEKAGVDKYIAGAYKVVKKEMRTHAQKIQEAQENLNREMEAAMRERGRALTAEEQAEIIEANNVQEKEAKMKPVSEMFKMLSQIGPLAYQNIKRNAQNVAGVVGESDEEEEMAEAA